MYEKDYILRIAGQFAHILKRLVGLKQAGEYKAALALVSETLERQLGLSPELAKRMSASDLMRGMDTEHAVLLAHLLKELGDIAASQGQQADGENLYAKALTIAVESLLAASEPVCREHVPLVDGLVEKLEHLRLSEDLNDGLSQFYSRIGDEARAKYYFRQSW